MAGCERFEDALVELALGTIAVEDRAAALGHVSRCGACETRLAELAAVVDRTLSVAHEVQPPAGFESRVLASFRPRSQPHNRRRRTRVTVAAAALVVALLGAAGGAFVVLRATERDRAAGRHHRADLAAGNGTYFGTRRLTAAVPGARGTVFAYEGTPSWVLVTAGGEPLEQAAAVDVVVEATDATVRMAARRGPDGWSWGGALPFSLREIRAVRVVVDGSTTVLARVYS